MIEKKHTSGFLRLVNQVKCQVKEITATDLKTKISDERRFYLIDVRETIEFQKGCIFQATHLSKGIIERDIEKYIPDFEAQIIVYCSGGFRSCLVADNLQKMGYCNVASLQGGLRAWLESGYSLTIPT